jgi:hypothetical protein
MKLEEISLMLAKYSLVFPSCTLTAPTLKLWHELLGHESLEDLNVALRTLVKEPGRVYFPTPGEVVKVLNTMKGKDAPPAAEEWEKVMRLAAGGGDLEYALAYFKTNPAACSAIRQVGWKNICTCDVVKELPFRKREFEKYYTEAAERGIKQEQIVLSREESVKMVQSLPSEIKQKLLTRIN